jgi:ABC-type branched-subunit amino acid transport system permease subunit
MTGTAAIPRLASLLNGPEDIGRSGLFWTVAAIVAGALLLLPAWASEFQASNVAFYLLNVPMALGLGVLWGYCGVLSFGQVAYFGLGGYAYGVIAGNLMGTAAGSLVGTMGGLLLCAVVGAVFGYFVFYARVQSWIVPILTLVFTLLLETFLGQTAGYQWRIGRVQLGGYNGMTGIPSFQIGGFIAMGYSFYYLALAVVAGCYLACRVLVNSHIGMVMLAIREDPLRAELLGYDIRRHQLVVFIIAAALAGMSGILYVQWGNYITPTQVGLLQASLPVIWVAVGGREKLLAVVISTFALNWLNYSLSSSGNEYAAPLIMGSLLVLVMLAFPRGIVVTLADALRWRTRRQARIRREEESA